MEQIASDVSLSSRLALNSNMKGKTATSTNHSKGQQYDSNLGLDSQDESSIAQGQRVRELQKRIGAADNWQKQLQSKFQKVIESLTREISKKDEMNLQLQRELTDLQSQLAQSRRDLGIIVEYLTKKKQKNQHQSRGQILNSTKETARIDKSTSGSKQLDLSGQGIRNQRKNPSPRMLLLKKSFKS